MKTVKLNVILSGSTLHMEVTEKYNLLRALNENGVYLPALCGGKGTCGKCKIRLLEGALHPSAADISYFSKVELMEGYRLSCTAYPEEDLTLQVAAPEENRFSAVTGYHYQPVEAVPDSITVKQIEFAKDKISFSDKIRDGGEPLGFPMLKKLSDFVDTGAQSVYAVYDGKRIAMITKEMPSPLGIGIDIGTTTIGFGLVDMVSGKVLGQHSMVNTQRKFGADVISRILNANGGDLAELSTLVKRRITGGIEEICRINGRSVHEVMKVAVAGNTTMLHFLLNLSCKTIGAYPFTPVTLDLMHLDYKALFEEELECTVDILPGISAYVGADITAGIYYTELLKSEKPAMLLDIGTNGEMAVSFGGRLICTSTAAGPAFEGGNIKWGTGSVPGAVSKALYQPEEKTWRISTIGGAPPIGICGSGVIDIVHQCFKNGFIGKSGRFDKAFGNGGVTIAKWEDGAEINFTQKDVRQLQLAKSAIRSGIDVILGKAGLAYEDIDKFYIAGGFGYRINIESAAGIGLLPAEISDKIVAVGNSSLGGAVRYLLDGGASDTLAQIVQKAEEHNLSEDKDFNTGFVNNLNF